MYGNKFDTEEIVKTKVEYEHIFSDDVQKQKEMISMFQKLF